MDEQAYVAPGVARVDVTPKDASALDEIDSLLHHLGDELSQLAAAVAPVSRFDLPEVELSRVREEPPNVLRAFVARLEDSVAAARSIRLKLDL